MGINLGGRELARMQLVMKKKCNMSLLRIQQVPRPQSKHQVSGVSENVVCATLGTIGTICYRKTMGRTHGLIGQYSNKQSDFI